MMRGGTRILTIGAVALCWAIASTAGSRAAADRAATAFDRFKALAGDWVAAEEGEMAKKGDLVARYHLTAEGTAVVEELFPGTPHEMTTVYHQDGADLVLTHYCVHGNQPRMRAKETTAPRVSFTFDGGANIDQERDPHMHSATFDFVGAGELRSSWTEYEQGKPGTTVAMHLVRKGN